MAGTYSLTFLGFSSETSETLQKFKTICVADLELTVEKTQELLASDALTKVLITSDSLPEITRISHLLTNVGAQVAIVSTSQELPPEDEDDTDSNTDGAEVELTFDLEDILGEAVEKKKENKEPKEYHLDLDSSEDLASLGFSDDAEPDLLPNEGSSEEGAGSLNTAPHTTPSPTIGSSFHTESNESTPVDTLSFDEEPLPATANSSDPISQLVSDVAQASSKPWSENDLALNLGAPIEELPSPEEISKVTSALDFDDLTVLPAPLPKELLSARNPQTSSATSPPAPTSSAEPAPVTATTTLPSISNQKNSHSNTPPALIDEITSAVDLAFEAPNGEIPPTSPVSSVSTRSIVVPPEEATILNQAPVTAPTPKINLAAALDSISFEKLLDDDPPPFIETPPAPLPTNPTSIGIIEKNVPSEKVQAEKVHSDRTTAENPTPEPPKSASQSTPPSHDRELRSTPLESPTVEPIDEEKPITSGGKREIGRHRDGFSKGQLGGIFLVGVTILVIGNWMLTPEQEEPTVPSIEQVESVTKSSEVAAPNKGSSKTTSAPPAEKTELFSSTLAGVFSGDGYEVSVTSSQQGANLSTKVLLTTPKPAELSLEEIAQNTPPRIWLKRAESDAVQLKQVGTGEWSGTVPTYIFVEKGAERRRLPGMAMLSGRLNPDGASGELRVEITYSPPGDTALPAPGSIIEAAGKDLYRVSVSAVVAIKRK